MNATRIMMVAGERSGDIYGGELVAALRARIPGLSAFGCGGEAMREAGVETLEDAHRLSMAGITEVVTGLARAWRALRRLAREARRRRPALAVLIDFPDFNLRLAKRLRATGIRVIYFVSPQIRAWRRGRIRQLRERVEKVLCIFDFEEKLYREAGVPVEYVGHPLLDRVRARMTREEFYQAVGLDPALTTVALLPGSRRREVAVHLPIMLDAAERLQSRRRVQVVTAVAPSLGPEWVDSRFRGNDLAMPLAAVGSNGPALAGGANASRLTRATYDALAYSDLALVASGTATVEAAILGRPMVVVYRVSPLTWAAGKFLVKVPFYSMVNLLAGKAVVRELMQGEFTAAKLAAAAEFLLDHPEARETMIRELAAVRARLGAGHAIERAADAVVRLLEPPPASARTAVR
ncbi:MAG: lipid-A-disaccharide synthase [Acidobacteria bacterium]|nr:MAG: lipid-A-disaccharide synthase [Acidobacteriota bacterium]